MKAVIQRVSTASLTTNGVFAGELAQGGLVVLLGIEQGDEAQFVDTFVNKIANLRIFTDQDDKLNLSLLDTKKGVMVVPNFTLAADCRKGRRPSFERSADASFAQLCFLNAVRGLIDVGVNPVVSGTFGADMQVQLTNDGPITIVLTSDEICKKKG